MALFYVLVGVFALGGACIVGVYNSLARARSEVDEAWAAIDAELKHRHDLIPNLVGTVKGHAGEERGTLLDLMHARNEAAAATSPLEAERAESQLTSALACVTALAERYPQLRAAHNFRALERELAEIEDELEAARRTYNTRVREFNARIKGFPPSLIASSMAFRPRELFEIELPAERAVPPVLKPAAPAPIR